MPLKGSSQGLGIFTHDIYRRIQLAAAVLLVRNTPKGVSPEAHATDIQRKLKTLWLNSTMSTGASQLNVLLNSHILFELQELLAFRLSSIISESSQAHLKAYAPSDSNYQEIHETCEVQTFCNNLKVKRSEIQASSNFIQAVIHLKTLAEAQTTVPLDKYITSVSSMCNRQNMLLFSQNSEDKLKAQSLPSDDSGFFTTDGSDANNKLSESVRGVASSFILYIINSCNVNELLQKSIESIIIHLRDIALGDDTLILSEAINQWRGSVYHHAMLAFQSIFDVQLVDMNRPVPYQQLCLMVLQEVLHHLCDTNYSVKMCNATNLWVQILDNVFKKIENLVHLVHWSDSSYEETEDISLYHNTKLILRMQKYLQEFESCFCVFSLLKIFLQNADYCFVTKSGEKKTTTDETQPKKANTVGNLWRKHYTVDVDSEATRSFGDETSKLKINDWRNCLSESFQNMLSENSLIAIIMSECIPLLQNLDF